MAQCIDCGLEVVGGRLKVKLKEAGGIVCDDNLGLSVTFPAAAVPTPSSTSFNAATGAVIVSPDACNGIIPQGNGLWAAKSCTISSNASRGYTGQNQSVISFVPPIGMSSGGTYILESDAAPVSVVNTSNCTVHGLWNVQAFGGVVEGNPGFDGYAFVTAQIVGPGASGTFDVSTPVTYFRMDNRTGPGAVSYGINNMWEEAWISFAPGVTYAFRARVNIVVTAGTGTWYDTPFYPGFEFHWHLTTAGGC